MAYEHRIPRTSRRNRTSTHDHSGGAGSGGAVKSESIESSVGGSWYLDTAQSVATSTMEPIEFDSEDYDTHDAMNLSTGKYSAPVSGRYLVTATSGINNLGAKDTVYLYVYVGTAYRRSQARASAGASADEEVGVSMSHVVTANAGDDIYAGIWHNYGSARDTFSGSLCSMTITFLGVA